MVGGGGQRPRGGSEAVAVAGNQLMGGAAVGTPKAVGRVGFHMAVYADQPLWVGHRWTRWQRDCHPHGEC